MAPIPAVMEHCAQFGVREYVEVRVLGQALVADPHGGHALQSLGSGKRAGRRHPCCRSGLRPAGLKSPQDGWHASLDSFHLEATASQNFEASQRVPSPRRPQKSVWESL